MEWIVAAFASVLAATVLAGLSHKTCKRAYLVEPIPLKVARS
jgi:hypothetical protein